MVRAHVAMKGRNLLAKKKDPVSETEAERNYDAEISNLESELGEAKDMLLRTAAEYDNFKKRSEREREGLAAFVAAQTVKTLLTPYDNLERSVSADAESPDYIKGVEMTVKQFKEAFSKLGLAEFGEAGETFDPELHDAVMHKEDDSLGENVISRVLQKGYKLGETVLKHAMVEVAN